jgi:hypothetical protein
MQDHGPVKELRQTAQAVGHKDHRSSAGHHRTQATVALLLEEDVPNREYFVHNQHVGLKECDQREPQSSLHPT